MMTASGTKKRSTAPKSRYACCHARSGMFQMFGYEPKSTHCVYHGKWGCVATWKMKICEGKRGFSHLWCQ